MQDFLRRMGEAYLDALNAERTGVFSVCVTLRRGRPHHGNFSFQEKRVWIRQPVESFSLVRRLHDFMADCRRKLVTGDGSITISVTVFSGVPVDVTSSFGQNFELAEASRG